MHKRTKTILGSLLIILAILFFTVPSEADYDRWLADKYNIQESDELYYYTQSDNDVELFDMSTYTKGFGIFRFRQQNFQYIKDEKLLGESHSQLAFKELDHNEGLTIQTFEIGKTIFPVAQDNFLWKLLVEPI